MTSISKAEYLKRYMSGKADEEDKKKRKKEKKEKRKYTGMKIIDGDAFVSVNSTAREQAYSSDEEREESRLNKEVTEKIKKAPKFKSSFVSVDPDPSELPLKREETMSSTAEQKSDNGSSRRRRHDSESPVRRQRHDSDQSPPRRRQERTPDLSPPRRRRNDSDDSPPRRKKEKSPDLSPQRRQRHDSDNSPPRKRLRDSPPPRRRRNDSDNSPPRRGRPDQSPQRQRRYDSDSSAPRRRNGSPSARVKEEDLSPPRSKVNTFSSRRHVDEPEIEHKGNKTTLDGKIAGLQTAAALREESLKIKERESKMFAEMDVETSGRGAATVVREKQIKRGKDKTEDKEKKEREATKQQELDEKYKSSWNLGVRQIEQRKSQLEEMARVAAEPLARAADNEAMNEHLKDVLREEDPMVSFIQKKNREEAIDRGDLVYPTYNKPFTPNRYGIRPGYRWDGVDRSNGFEGKLALMDNKKKAQDSEYYQNLALYE